MVERPHALSEHRGGAADGHDVRLIIGRSISTEGRRADTRRVRGPGAGRCVVFAAISMRVVVRLGKGYRELSYDWRDIAPAERAP